MSVLKKVSGVSKREMTIISLGAGRVSVQLCHILLPCLLLQTLLVPGLKQKAAFCEGEEAQNGGYYLF